MKAILIELLKWLKPRPADWEKEAAADRAEAWRHEIHEMMKLPTRPEC